MITVTDIDPGNSNRAISVMAGTSCSNAEKREALGALMRRYLKALEDTGAFPALPDEARAPTPQPQAKEWVLFYLAQHHDKLGETGTAKMLCCCK